MRTTTTMQVEKDIAPLKEVLAKLKNEGKILIALLYGSNAKDRKEETEIIDEILISVERDVSILRLDDEDESPFIIQEALKGVHLIEPDDDALYAVSHRTLHEAESIRFRRAIND